MKRLLLLLIASFAIPVIARSSTSSEIHKLCSKAKDYKGCVELKSQKTTITECGVIEAMRESGYRECIASNGAKYMGSFTKGLMNGTGTLTWPNGSKYIGEWKKSKKDGQGILSWPNGDRYSGEWRNNKFHGIGTYTWATGDKYVGEYKNGNRHGQATLSLAKGDKYVGEFKNNKRSGKGTYIWADGSSWTGKFSDGEMIKQASNSNNQKSKNRNNASSSTDDAMLERERIRADAMLEREMIRSTGQMIGDIYSTNPYMNKIVTPRRERQSVDVYLYDGYGY